MATAMEIRPPTVGKGRWHDRCKREKQVKTTHRRRRRGPATRSSVVAPLFLLASSLVSSAWAQESGDGGGVDENRSGFWISPRVSLSQTLTNNSPVGSPYARSEQVTEISPGVRAYMNLPRIKGSVDYSLAGRFYTQHTYANGLQHTLDGNATVEALDDHGFIDLRGLVDQLSISPFDPHSTGSTQNGNKSQTSLFRFSPYYRGVAGSAEYEFRYAMQSVSTDTASRSDFTSNGWNFHVVDRNPGQLMGWSFDASQQKYDYSLGRDTASSAFKVGLIFPFTSQLTGSLLVGTESNDQLTLAKQSYRTTELNLEWRPSDRTRMSVGLEKRFFGNGHDIELEHRTARTVWRYTDSKGVVSNALEDALPVLGSYYDLVDSLFSSLEPDPIKRAQLVESELLRLGLPSRAELYQRYLTSSATLERNQQLSVLLQGTRGVLTFVLFRNNSRRVDTLFNPGSDSFDVSSSIQQRGWSVLYAHRLTPLTSFNASINGIKIASTNAALGNSLKTLTFGVTTQLGLRTSGSVQLLHEVFSGTMNPYKVTSITGVITHRF